MTTFKPNFFSPFNLLAYSSGCKTFPGSETRSFVKFIPSTYEEFEHVSNKVIEGTYDYNIIEYQKFSVKNYKNWLNTIDKNKRF